MKNTSHLGQDAVDFYQLRTSLIVNAAAAAAALAPVQHIVNTVKVARHPPTGGIGVFCYPASRHLLEEKRLNRWVFRDPVRRGCKTRMT